MVALLMMTSERFSSFKNRTRKILFALSLKIVDQRILLHMIIQKFSTDIRGDIKVLITEYISEVRGKLWTLYFASLSIIL